MSKKAYRYFSSISAPTSSLENALRQQRSRMGKKGGPINIVIDSPNPDDIGKYQWANSQGSPFDTLDREDRRGKDGTGYLTINVSNPEIL